MTQPAVARVEQSAPPHEPYVPATEAPAELTPGVIILGVLLGLVFAASSVYLALKVSLTVSASIPVAVLSITIFRWVSRVLGRPPATILQNNMVQTTGSAGESIAAGISFTLPALLLFGYNLPWSTVIAVGIVGGVLGVIFMIPLRRSLIVKEHENLKYPEGTACAQVLIVGEERGVQARTVFMGFGLGAIYKFLTSGFHLWLEVPRRAFESAVAGARTQLFGEIQAEISPELTGVGYIIGPRIAGYLFGGGVLAWFALIPAIKFFGAGFTAPIFPASKLIADMSASEIRSNYIYYIGAGAVTAAGIITLGRTLPTIWQALLAGLKDFAGTKSGDAIRRTERDMPMIVVVGGALLCGIAMVLLPQIHINIVGAVLALFFAFLFVTVSSRITGQIGSSSNPVSGMTVATLLLTSLLFLAVGWVGIEYRVLALSIGGVVCVAASTAGATSQDLKTGFLVGATPRRQQLGLLIGVTASALLVGGIIQFLNTAKQTVVRKSYPGVVARDIEAQPVTLKQGRLLAAGAGDSTVLHVGLPRRISDDLIRRQASRLGSGGRPLHRSVPRPASQRQRARPRVDLEVGPWGLILVGAFLAVAMELIGVPSLPVAVGVYLPISTSATMFMGGVLRWLVDRRMSPEERAGADADSGPGVLFSSGLIAGGAITGVVLAGFAAKGLDTALDLSKRIGVLSSSALFAMIAYVVLIAVPVYAVARARRLP